MYCMGVTFVSVWLVLANPCLFDPDLGRAWRVQQCAARLHMSQMYSQGVREQLVPSQVKHALAVSGTAGIT
jgi:hypothetical protein